MQLNLSMEPNVIQGLMESIHQIYGYDFRGYSRASLHRRLQFVMHRHGLLSLNDLHDRLVSDASFFESILSHLTVTTSEMFRDPPFYESLLQEVLPRLATYPSIKIWHAGCSTGEEVYSLALLLQKNHLLEQTLIYASDINPVALQKARDGVYSEAAFKKAAENYSHLYDDGDLSAFFAVDGARFALESSLRKHIVFVEHNLVSDHAFAEVQLILCRNVLIYFDDALRNRALQIFDDSLCYRGFLALGMRESLKFSVLGRAYNEVIEQTRIYQKRSSCSQQKF